MIETERLLLREMTLDDSDALYKVLADTDIMKHYPYVFDEQRVHDWIARCSGIAIYKVTKEAATMQREKQ